LLLRRGDELRQEREEEHGQLWIEDVHEDRRRDDRAGRSVGLRSVRTQRAGVTERSPGEEEQIRDPKVLERLEGDRARMKQSRSAEDRREEVRHDAQGAPERSNDTRARSTREA